MKRLGRLVVVLLAAGALFALGGAAHFALHGVSSRPEPSALEVRVARTARHLLVPAAARAASNPIVRTPEVLSSGRAHFADHCATCHGNDGKGQTNYGRKLSPRAPDMTLLATQSLSDGELFWIIENGVRLTGMPGFGDEDPSNDAQSWHLVHFIRRLPAITPEELATMDRLNPTLSRADVEREKENEEFLSGGQGGDVEHHH